MSSKNVLGNMGTNFTVAQDFWTFVMQWCKHAWLSQLIDSGLSLGVVGNCRCSYRPYVYRCGGDVTERMSYAQSIVINDLYKWEFWKYVCFPLFLFFCLLSLSLPLLNFDFALQIQLIFYGHQYSIVSWLLLLFSHCTYGQLDLICKQLNEES